jgi:SAM-dependent methyltransferase
VTRDAPNLARYYDAVIPWHRRLVREMPLLERMARAAGTRLLIPACGTGGHLVALAERGFSVLGFDVDEQALEIARQKIETPTLQGTGRAEVTQLSMQDAGSLGPVFDAAFCLGNALAGLSAPGQLAAALRGVTTALRPGGLFLTQNLNYDQRWKQKAHWFPLLWGEISDEEVLLVKFADYEAEAINFYALFLSRSKEGGPWRTDIRTSRQIPLFHDLMVHLFAEAGLGVLHTWGDYTESPFDPEKSNDLIMVGSRR